MPETDRSPFRAFSGSFFITPCLKISTVFSESTCGWQRWPLERAFSGARRLGYASANSFAASVCHWLKDGRQHVKYIYQRELIPRSEVDSLTPPRRKEPHETH